jgi:hypothetical protein
MRISDTIFPFYLSPKFSYHYNVRFGTAKLCWHLDLLRRDISSKSIKSKLIDHFGCDIHIFSNDGLMTLFVYSNLKSEKN